MFKKKKKRIISNPYFIWPFCRVFQINLSKEPFHMIPMTQWFSDSTFLIALSSDPDMVFSFSENVLKVDVSWGKILENHLDFHFLLWGFHSLPWLPVNGNDTHFHTYFENFRSTYLTLSKTAMVWNKLIKK